jgi:hypothetical protein
MNMPLAAQIVLISLAILFILLLQVKASIFVLRDELSEPIQRAVQFLLIWLLPIIGAIIVLAVHRPPEKASGKYREQPDPGDDYGFPALRGGRGRSDTDPDSE